MARGVDIESQNFQYRESSNLNLVQDKLQILIIGDAQTGKSHLASLLTKRGFNEFLQHRKTDIINLNYKGVDKTIGCDCRISIRSYNNRKYKLKIWDLSGDKNQRNYLDIYLSQLYCQIHAIMFCFDVTNLKTLENFKKWIKSMLTQKIIDQSDEVFDDNSINNYSRSSSIAIQEDQDSLITLQNYNGLSIEQLMKIPFIFVGCKMDLIPFEKQNQIQKKCTKKVLNIEIQINKMFSNQNNDSLYLISTKFIKHYQDEFQRLEGLYQRILIQSSQDLQQLQLKTNPISLLELRLDESFWKLNFSDPIKKKFNLMKIYIKHCLLSLTCKKSKK